MGHKECRGKELQGSFSFIFFSFLIHSTLPFNENPVGCAQRADAITERCLHNRRPNERRNGLNSWARRKIRKRYSRVIKLDFMIEKWFYKPFLQLRLTWILLASIILSFCLSWANGTGNINGSLLWYFIGYDDDGNESFSFAKIGLDSCGYSFLYVYIVYALHRWWWNWQITNWKL